ncbi:uncharacterized protein KZ484_011342 isoform 1-T1 [Pholidichthys leucotaenia]
MDIYNYLVNTPSRYTGESLKAYKSLDAYSYFVAGLVRNVLISPVITSTVHYVVKAQVHHSQKMSDPPLKPWVIMNQDGVILSSHCTCMAGLGETCSHVAAVLFAVECAVHLSQGQTCTDVPCAWNTPTANLKLPFAALRDIDFSKPKTKQRMSMQKKKHIPRKRESKPIGPPSDDDHRALYQRLHQTSRMTGKQCAILSLVEPYNQEYIPQVAHNDCPASLDTLFSPDCLHLTFEQLLNRCEQVQQLLKVTPEQVKFVEETTRSQNKCVLWHQQRVGRITASIFKEAAQTHLDAPSRSLLNKICYPVSFTSKATK